MTVYLQVNPIFEKKIPFKRLEAAIQTVLEDYADDKLSDLTLVITDTEEIKSLHSQFMDDNTPTDVLSFPSGGVIDPETNTSYLGDIIISFPEASTQAIEFNHAIEDELELLAIHGCLHLLGYDHSTEEEQTSMWSAQKIILQHLQNPLADSY